MWTIRKIAGAELQTLFYSPLAWLMLVLFGVLVFGQFYELFDLAVRTQELGDSIDGVTRRLYTGQDAMTRGLFVSLLDRLFYFFPLLTMGLISREMNTGGIKLLDSSPVTTWQVVAGKYLAMCLFSLLLIAILLMTVATGALTVPHLEMGAVFTALLGLYLLMCTYAAVGLFMSSLTSYPIVAAAGTLGVLGALTYVGGVMQDVNFVREITWWLDMNKRIHGLLDGLISSADVAYYLLVIGMCLIFTCFKLNFRKITISAAARVAAYAGVVVAVLALGYFTSRPALQLYADATSNRRNTLSPTAQGIMERIDGRVTITSWVNVLHRNVDYMLPSQRKNNDAFFERYLRFHPAIAQEYVYYYAPTDYPNDFARLLLARGAPADSLARRFCEINGLDPERLLTPEQAQELCPVDLAAENNPVIRTVAAEGGEVRPLRLFRDNTIVPGEREIAAAFLGLCDILPRVVYLTGRGSPDIAPDSREGYGKAVNSPTRRISLINQGFRVGQAAFADSAIPEGTDMLIVANPTEELAPGELDMIARYLERGGNMLLLADAGNERNMNRIAAPLGISFAEGYLVEPHPADADMYPHIAVGRSAEGASAVLGGRFMQPMRMATAIVMPEGEGYTPLMVTSEEGWLKKERANLLEGELAPDPAQGEHRRSHVTLAAVERQVGEKQQRVIVSSDAEWLSDMGLATTYPGVRSAPAELAAACFLWLADGRLPLDVAIGGTRDTAVNFKDAGLPAIYYIYVWALPLLMAGAGVLLYRRRNGR